MKRLREFEVVNKKHLADLSAANNTKIVDETNCQLVYKLPSDYIRAELEEFMRYKANDLGIASWELNPLGLTDVYYKLLA